MQPTPCQCLPSWRRGDRFRRKPAGRRRDPARSSFWRASSRPIATFSFLSDEVEKQAHSLLFPAEMMDHHLSFRSNAAPLPQETNVAEEVRFDRHGIVACHVSRCIGALDVKLIGLRDHGARIVDAGGRVQRHL